MAKTSTPHTRSLWPRRAIVTAGMPYGNKNLHFGHVGGVFVPADFFARFLRDRIGAENVLFVSGTDCYGSPIMESYRKLCDEGYTKSIEEYVEENHDRQAATLAGYDVACDFFGGSALAPAAKVHEQVTDEILHRLKDAGVLTRRSTLQFYDPRAGQFLNGRQVVGRCPIQGCKSEKAYADECDLGHQFEPEELIAPVSALTGETPELRPVENLYFDLPAYRDYLTRYTDGLEDDDTVRPVVVKTMEEWLGDPVLYIQNKFREAFDAVEGELPAHTVVEPEGNKSSFTVVFPSWRERDEAHAVLGRGRVRFRSGKALVPFRITGNISWGVPVDDSCGCSGLTCWVWPESLWAPISFTRTALAEAERAGDDARYSSLDWHDWWCTPDAHAYQFIGQDNIYFYGIAQTALWEALGCNMQQSTLVANYHVLYMGKKASSSSKTPPPPASELLEHYDAEQLRAHFLSLGLGEKPVSFSPKAYDLRETGKNPDGTPLLARDDKRVIDPVLKEGALLTGVFNRLARSCFYGVAIKEGDPSSVRTGCIPAGEATPAVRAAAEEAIRSFEEDVHRFAFHHALGVCDAYLRAANKRWSDASKAAKAAQKEDQAVGDALMHQALVDAFAELRVATVLMHPVVPRGCELICEHFAMDPDVFFSWEHIFDTTDELVRALGEEPGTHGVKELPPRFDFFAF